MDLNVKRLAQQVGLVMLFLEHANNVILNVILVILKLINVHHVSLQNYSKDLSVWIIVLQGILINLEYVLNATKYVKNVLKVQQIVQFALRTHID
jgi:hypothetical protein